MNDPRVSDTITTAVATLDGVGTTYHIAPDDTGDRFDMVRSSGPNAQYIGSYPSFRAAVLWAVNAIEREIEEETGDLNDLPVEAGGIDTNADHIEEETR